MKRKRNHDPFKFNSNMSAASYSSDRQRNDATVQSYSSSDDEHGNNSSDYDSDVPIEDDTFNKDDMIDQLLNTMKTNITPPQPQVTQKSKAATTTARPVKVIEPPRPRVPLDEIFTATSNRIINNRVFPVWKDEDDSSTDNSSRVNDDTSDSDSGSDSDSDILSGSKVASNAMVISKPSKNIMTKDTGNLFDNIFAGLTGNDNSNHKSKNSHHPHNNKHKKRKVKIDAGACRCNHCENNRQGKKSIYDKNHRSECFMCAWGNLYHDGISSKHIRKMNKIMSNYGGCENMELAQQLVLYYKRYVYKKHSRKNGGKLPMFTLAVALVHIENHILSAKIFLGESIKLFLQIRLVIANNLFDENGKHDRHDLNGVINVQKVICSTFNQDPKKMMFNFDEGREEMERIGQNFRFMEKFKQRDDRIQLRLKHEKRKRKSKHNYSEEEEEEEEEEENEEFSV